MYPSNPLIPCSPARLQTKARSYRAAPLAYRPRLAHDRAPPLAYRPRLAHDRAAPLAYRPRLAHDCALPPALLKIPLSPLWPLSAVFISGALCSGALRRNILSIPSATTYPPTTLPQANTPAT